MRDARKGVVISWQINMGPNTMLTFGSATVVSKQLPVSARVICFGTIRVVTFGMRPDMFRKRSFRLVRGSGCGAFQWKDAGASNGLDLPRRESEVTWWMFFSRNDSRNELCLTRFLFPRPRSEVLDSVKNMLDQNNDSCKWLQRYNWNTRVCIGSNVQRHKPSYFCPRCEFLMLQRHGFDRKRSCATSHRSSECICPTSKASALRTNIYLHGYTESFTPRIRGAICFPGAMQ